MTKFYDTPQLSLGGHWRCSPEGWWRSDEYAPGVPNPAIAEREALLRVVRAADVMVCHKNNPKWADGLIPWREIAEGVDVDDLIALAQALEALPKGILDENLSN